MSRDANPQRQHTASRVAWGEWGEGGGACAEAPSPVRVQVKTADDMLKKSENAYNLFGERMQQSRGKAEMARKQEEVFPRMQPPSSRVEKSSRVSMIAV